MSAPDDARRATAEHWLSLSDERRLFVREHMLGLAKQLDALAEDAVAQLDALARDAVAQLVEAIPAPKPGTLVPWWLVMPGDVVLRSRTGNLMPWRAKADVEWTIIESHPVDSRPWSDRTWRIVATGVRPSGGPLIFASDVPRGDRVQIVTTAPRTATP